MNSAPISTACASLGRLSVCILGLQSAETTVEDRFINARQICPDALWMKSKDSVEAHWEKLVAQTGSLCSLWTRTPPTKTPVCSPGAPVIARAFREETPIKHYTHFLSTWSKYNWNYAAPSWFLLKNKQKKNIPNPYLPPTSMHNAREFTCRPSHWSGLHWCWLSRTTLEGSVTRHQHFSPLSWETQQEDKTTVHRRGAQYKPTATPPERSKACSDAAFCVLTAPLDDQCVTIRARHM